MSFQSIFMTIRVQKGEKYQHWLYFMQVPGSRLKLRLDSEKGSSFSRSFLARLEESRRPYGSTQVPNCTENDSGSPSSVKCPPKNVQQSNRSMCCSFGIHNSSHSQNPCTLVNQGMSSAQHTPSY
ncbi:unnamed protein product, partial [Larinioides sclopetarius]